MLDTITFLALCNKVLSKQGRGTLDANGRAVVEVRSSDRVMQILAGPGSGKTEMLSLRVLYQIMVLGTKPERVLVTTFTNRAATELTLRLTERSQQLLEQARQDGVTVADPLIHSVRVGTIHSLCATLLAEYSTEYAAQGIEVIDEIEATVRLAQQFTFLGYRPRTPGVIDRLLGMGELSCLMRPPWKTDSNWPVGLMDRVGFVERLMALQTETWEPRCADAGTDNGLESAVQNITADLKKLHERWLDYLHQQAVQDFATIQRRFLNEQDRVIPHIDHAFVDEFQDTNPIQFALHTAWLQREETRLTVVGDDDQSLYRFRGSDIACFAGLGAWCKSKKVSYRQEVLETNWRSTKAIVSFSKSFREVSGLEQLSMSKSVVAGSKAPQGTPVRLLTGPWTDVCARVAEEVAQLGIGVPGGATTETAAVLMFSTSESGGNATAASQLRAALADKGVRSFNARSKTAAENSSPVMELAALVSYFFDPVSRQPVGKNGRMVEVWASNQKPEYAAAAITHAAPFPTPNDHAAIQKRFRKQGSRDLPSNHRTDRADVLCYVDEMRHQFRRAVRANTNIRMTLAGLISRILTFPCYRNCGYTVSLFRQALFTHLLEANTAPTRRTTTPLDAPLTPTIEADNKLAWPRQFWSMLRILGSLLENTTLDDEEVEAFSDGAVNLLTFHQAKGLEFDHVFVAGTGRNVAVHSAILTEVFSGRSVAFSVQQGQPITRNKKILALATGDMLRELYVAFTRAKKTLTILFDPQDASPFMRLNSTVAKAFASTASTKVAKFPTLGCNLFKE